jgi:hypothetical protein
MIKYLLTFLLLSTSAIAQQSWTWGLGQSIGISQYRGDLGRQDSELTYIFQIIAPKFYVPDSPWGFHLSIDTVITQTENKKSDFPFRENTDVNILGFLFIPNVCRQLYSVWETCFGLGQGTVNVNQSGNRRDYGTWNYQFLAQYQLKKSHWRVQFMSKYIGRIEQQVNEVDTQFSFFTLGLGGVYIF